jgi:DNA-binding response OmpR family regulator
MTSRAEPPPALLSDSARGLTRTPRAPLGGTEQAVLRALIEAAGRVISRHEIARRAGLTAQSQRRADSILVTIRRSLPPGGIRTVRSRGWILELGALDAARALVGDD